MKKLFLLTLLICGVTATSFAQNDWSIRYQGELNVGFATGGKLKNDLGEKVKTNFSRPTLETVHGVRVGDYLFGGLGVGLQYAYGDFITGSDAQGFGPGMPQWNTLLMPIFLNLKGYYPVMDDLAPYISLSLGGSAVLASDFNVNYSERHTSPLQGGYDYTESVDVKHKGGFYCDFGVGLNYKRLNFGLGMMHQAMKIEGATGSVGRGGPRSETYDLKVKNTSFYVKVGLNF